MTETPLDSHLQSAPDGDQKQIIPVLKSEWVQLGKWAQWYGYAGLSAFIFVVLYGSMLFAPSIMRTVSSIGPAITYILYNLLVAFIAYYSLRFGKALKDAIQSGEQLQLEQAFRKLRPVLIASAIGCILNLFQLTATAVATISALFSLAK